MPRKNPEEKKAYQAEYYQLHKEKFVAYEREKREKTLATPLDKTAIKVCSNCGLEKKLVQFSPLYSQCKDCRNQLKKKRRAENPEEVRRKERESLAMWKDNNREHYNQYQRSYYFKNQEACKEKMRQRRIKYPEKAKESDLKKSYGITLADWNTMLEAQGNRCANEGCHTVDPGGKYGTWHVDHDHITGKIRGLLCASCNLTLGNAKDDVNRLEGLVAYLKIHTAKIE
jgi:hypothetical protein